MHSRITPKCLSRLQVSMAPPQARRTHAAWPRRTVRDIFGAPARVTAASTIIPTRTARTTRCNFQNIALTSASKIINQRRLYSIRSGGSPETVNLCIRRGFIPAWISSTTRWRCPRRRRSCTWHLQVQLRPIPIALALTSILRKRLLSVADDGGKNSVNALTGGIQQNTSVPDLSWKLAYNLAIPGYYGLNNGIMTNAASH